VSSAPHEDNIKFHIRALGDWSKSLVKLVAEKAVVLSGGRKGLKMTIHVEGPFGIPSVDFENADVYKTFMLVTGGIGVTPAQSLFNNFVHQYCEGRDIRKCIYLWSVKDRAMIDSIDEARHDHSSLGAADKPADMASLTSANLPRSFQPNLLNFKPPSRTGDTYKKDVEAGSVVDASKVIPVATDSTEYKSVVIADKRSHHVKQESFSWDQATIGSADPFHVEFYLTCIRNKEEFAKANIDPETQPYVKFGRPDLPAKWQAVAEMCVKEGITRVAVLVCGPGAMVEQVQDLCSAPLHVTTKSDGMEVSGTVTFELHKEEFDF
jgi:NAD(P)H-flavin reductase